MLDNYPLKDRISNALRFTRLSIRRPHTPVTVTLTVSDIDQQFVWFTFHDPSHNTPYWNEFHPIFSAPTDILKYIISELPLDNRVIRIDSTKYSHSILWHITPTRISAEVAGQQNRYTLVMPDDVYSPDPTFDEGSLLTMYGLLIPQKVAFADTRGDSGHYVSYKMPART